MQDRPWVVYARPPFGGPEQVLKYLSRYVHRVAISNARLVFVGDGVVRFHYRDYAAGGITKTKELPAEEFLRRFLLHPVCWKQRWVTQRHRVLFSVHAGATTLRRCRTFSVSHRLTATGFTASCITVACIARSAAAAWRAETDGFSCYPFRAHKCAPFKFLLQRVQFHLCIHTGQRRSLHRRDFGCSPP